MRGLIALLLAVSVQAWAAALVQTVGGTQVFKWLPPTSYTDGSPIPAGAITGYKLYCGKASGVYDPPITLPANATFGTCSITQLGTLVAVVTTLAQTPTGDVAGVVTEIRESEFSLEVTRIIGAILVPAGPREPSPVSAGQTSVTCIPPPGFRCTPTVK